MNMNIDRRLASLSAEAPTAPPYGFDEFRLRRAAAASRRRTVAWGGAAAAGVLGLVALLALFTQEPDAAALVSSSRVLPDPPAAVDVPYQPAVVNVSQFELTTGLEEHIALLDAQISAARVYAAPPERVRQMEQARAQLNDSLQRVSHAQTLLGL